MLNFFRTNQILAAFFYLLYLLPFSVPAWLQRNLRDIDLGATGWLYRQLMQTSMGFWLSGRVFVGLFLFFVATMISQLVIDRQLDRNLTLFPGLFFLLIIGSMGGNLQFSPLLPALFFLLLSVWQLIRIYKKYAVMIHLYNAGFWLGMASLFLPQLSLLLLWEWSVLGKLRSPFSLRDALAIFLGWLSPNFIIGSWLYWKGAFASFFQTQYGALFALSLPSSDEFRSSEWIVVFALIVFLIFLFQLAFKKKEIGKKKMIQSLYELLVFVLFITVFFAVDVYFLQLAAFPLSIILALTFSQLSPQTAEGLHLLLYIAGLFLLYAPFIRF